MGDKWSPSVPERSSGVWGEGVKYPYHHDVVQPSPIGGRIGDVREDVVIQGVSRKHEKHEVAPLLVNGVMRVLEQL
jgi:hypothetical protein